MEYGQENHRSVTTHGLSLRFHFGTPSRSGGAAAHHGEDRPAVSEKLPIERSFVTSSLRMTRGVLRSDHSSKNAFSVLV